MVMLFPWKIFIDFMHAFNIHSNTRFIAVECNAVSNSSNNKMPFLAFITEPINRIAFFILLIALLVL